MKHEKLELYQRDIDRYGVQMVIVSDGMAMYQGFYNKSGGDYICEGKPHMTGKKIDDIKRKYHFKKLHVPKVLIKLLYTNLMARI